MRRIAVVGSGGSGKTHLARALGRTLGVPVIHLDAVYYDEEWNPLPHEQFAARQREMVGAHSWVIDGNHRATLPIRLEACDTVVIMDVPTRSALFGILSRQVRHGPGHHKNGVHNRLNLGVLRYVATYRRRMRPRVLETIERCGGGADVVRLTSRRAARRWMREIAEHRSPTSAAEAEPPSYAGDDK